MCTASLIGSGLKKKKRYSVFKSHCFTDVGTAKKTVSVIISPQTHHHNNSAGCVCVCVCQQKSDVAGDDVEVPVENQAFMDDFFAQVFPAILLMCVRV